MLSFSLQGGSRKNPEPELPWSQNWLRAVGLIPWQESPSGRQEQRHTRQALKGSLLWLVLSRGFPPAGASSRAPDTHGHTLGMSLFVWCSSCTDLGPEEKSLCGCQNVMCQFEVLQAGVKGPCLHRPENWLMRHLINYEPKPVYKVGFVREKGKATVRAVQRNLETSSSLLRWRLGLLWTF
jgi:hypothetical protein